MKVVKLILLGVFGYYVFFPLCVVAQFFLVYGGIALATKFEHEFPREKHEERQHKRTVTLTKNGLNPEIENLIYTGIRDKKCDLDKNGKCTPARDSYMEINLRWIFVEDKKYAEKLLLGEQVARQSLLNTQESSKIVDNLKDMYTYNHCFRSVSQNYKEYVDTANLLTERININSEDFWDDIEIKRKIEDFKFMLLENSIEEEFKGSKDKCMKFVDKKDLKNI